MNNDTPADAMKLLPCPFCGGRAIGTRTLAGVEFWSVECMTCTAKVDDPNSKQDAAKVWNTRTPSLAAQDVTPDAYMRTCRALHWRNAQLRYYGIDPYPLWDEAPYDPPEDFDFSKDGRKPRPLAAQDGLVEALRKVQQCLRNGKDPSGLLYSSAWIVSQLNGLIPEIDAALASIEVKSLSATKGDK